MRNTTLASSLALLVTFATSAGAAPRGGSPLHPLAVEDLPAQCRALAAVPASAKIPGPDFAAHLSFAACLAEDALRDVVPLADASSIAALELAMQPSLVILNDVIDHGDAHWRFLAEASKADLYSGMVVDMRVAATTPQMRASLEPQLAAWIHEADEVQHQLTALAATAKVGDDAVTRYERERFGA